MSSAEIAARLFLSLEPRDFRVLQAIELGMIQHELVPHEEIEKFSSLSTSETEYRIAGLHKKELIYRQSDPYLGYIMNYNGYDTLALNALIIVAVLIAVWRLGRLGALHAGTFLGMLVESCIYALAIGPLALLPLTGRLEFTGFAPHADGFWAKVILSCGAGFYEELVFRFVLLGTIFLLARKLGELKSVTSGIVALALSGAAFSAAHFLAPGENPELGAFVYRLSAGIVLGLIFLTRGFGIAAWTHVLYDVYALCLAPR